MLLLPFVPTCLLCVDECCSFFDQPFAGGSPAATHFLCLAKESKQRKATAGSSPFGVPSDAKQKMGRENNSLRSDIFPFSFHFSHHITGWLQAERPDWLASPRQGGGLAFGIVASSTDDAENFISTSSLRRPSERWDPVASAHHSTVCTTLGSNFRWNDEANEATEDQTISIPWRCAASPSRSPLESSRWRQVQIG